MYQPHQRSTSQKPSATKSHPQQPHPLVHLLRITLVEARRYHRHNPQAVESIDQLFDQVDQLWTCLNGTAMERYEFIKSRLQSVYLWDRDAPATLRSLFSPPIHLQQVHHTNRRKLISTLPSGVFFVEPMTNSPPEAHLV